MTLLWCYAALATALFAASTWLCAKSIAKNLQLEDQREALVDQIEASLDLLDECYQRLARAAETPVMTDEPIIREVINDIRSAKNAVMAVASLVVTYGSDEDE
jgi:hypothetical protein